MLEGGSSAPPAREPPNPRSMGPMTGDELRAALDAMHWTPQQFGKRFGLNPSTLSRWLRDQRPIPAWLPPVLDMLADDELRRVRATREAARH
jgi:hypothetical protein